MSFNPTSRFVQIATSMENMVLRGTKVKNTDFIYGLVVYTGEDTRLAQNSKKTHVKFSTVER
jgi:magnesium-transporting ATPase (P-type)